MRSCKIFVGQRVRINAQFGFHDGALIEKTPVLIGAVVGVESPQKGRGGADTQVRIRLDGSGNQVSVPAGEITPLVTEGDPAPLSLKKRA